MSRMIAAAFAALVFAGSASAHHGFGRFDRSREIQVEGTVTGIDFVNPHAYVYFDAVGPDGEVLEMRCEMRAATVLRRSGWSAEMFVDGTHIAVDGRPHRDDPASCYVETLALGDDEILERYQQLGEAAAPAERADRPARLPSGVPNLAGDWAQEQYLMARPPGGGGALVPKSLIEAVNAGEIAPEDVPESDWGARPVTYTEAGMAAAVERANAPPGSAPRLRCEITSILFDWTFDGPINRITQSEDTITIEYGRGLTRTVHMDMEDHPATIVPSRGGHSIGRWDGDTLVVDTVGFEPGILAGMAPIVSATTIDDDAAGIEPATSAGPVTHSGELHVVERFTLDPETMALKRDYAAEDALYFADPYVGSAVVFPADAQFAVDQCKELAYEYITPAEGEGQ